VTKNRFRGIVLGLSGDIGSALCAAMAVDAVGPEHVRAVTLPSRHTTERSLTDAASCVGTLGVPCDVLPIAAAVEELEVILHPLSAEGPGSRLQENLIAGSRGTVLMALAGSTGAMVVATADKSELALGEASGHGGTPGGFAPLKDLYTTEVFRLAALRNRWRPAGALGPAGAVIPSAVLDKAPDAEPRDDRTDVDALPPRAELDAILQALVEGGTRVAEIAARGHGLDAVKRIAALVTLAESGRRVCPPGVRLTTGAFGPDRRFPIVNRFRDDGEPAFRPDAAVEGDVGRPQVTHFDL
jgi:NAD+ synthase